MLCEPRGTGRKLTVCGLLGVVMSTMTVPEDAASRSRSWAQRDAAPASPKVPSAV